MEYYVCDTETTGVDVSKNELTEISIIRNKDLVQKTWNIKIKYPENCQKQALEITGKTIRQLLTTGKYIEEVIPLVNKFLEEDGVRPEERIILAHNYSFDQRFIEYWWKECGYVFPAKLWCCTLAMSKKYNKKLGLSKDAKLETMIEKFGIKHKKFHSATYDTQATYKLFLKLKQAGINEFEFTKASKSYVETIKQSDDLEKTDLENDACMDEVFNF